MKHQAITQIKATWRLDFAVIFEQHKQAGHSAGLFVLRFYLPRV
jgi:hypothetical protein